MSEPGNRYLPPRAPVDDPEPARRAPPAMPGIVRWGIGLLYCQFAIESLRLVLVLFDFLGLPDSAPTWAMFDLVSRCVMVAVPGWLIWMISRGRNWARNVYVVLFCIGMLHFIWASGVAVANVSVAPSVGHLIEMLLQVVGLAFLLTPRANDWFRRPGD